VVEFFDNEIKTFFGASFKHCPDSQQFGRMIPLIRRTMTAQDTHDLRPVSDRMPVTPATASGRAVTCIKQASKVVEKKGKHERRVGDPDGDPFM